MKPINVTEGNFEVEVLQSELPVLVDFYAEPWCWPCEAVGPMLERLAQEYAGRLKVERINTEENDALSMMYKVTSLPTLLILKSGAVADLITVGLKSKSYLKNKLDAFLTNEG